MNDDTSSSSSFTLILVHRSSFEPQLASLRPDVPTTRRPDARAARRLPALGSPDRLAYAFAGELDLGLEEVAELDPGFAQLLRHE